MMQQVTPTTMAVLSSQTRRILCNPQQIRRMLTKQPVQMRSLAQVPSYATHVALCEDDMDDGRQGLRWWAYSGDDDDGYDLHWIRVQPPRVGDRLWVAETWGLHGHFDATDWYSGSLRGLSEADVRERWSLAYAVDGASPQNDERWRSPICMPAWAARLTLIVTDVRAERLQSITEIDAIEEGCTGFDPAPADQGGTVYAWRGQSSAPDPRAEFVCRWQRAHGSDLYERNPFVWVVRSIVTNQRA